MSEGTSQHMRRIEAGDNDNLTSQSTFEPYFLSERDLMDDPVRWQVLDATP